MKHVKVVDPGQRGRYESLVEVLTQMYPAPEHVAYVEERWHDRAIKSESVAKKNKFRYYAFRILFVLAASTVPPAAAKAAFTDGEQRWPGALAVVLSVLVALLAALLEIMKPGQRWRLYQRLRFDLERTGWALAESGVGAEQFERFVDRTEHLLSRYADDYISEISVISATDRETMAGFPEEPGARRRTDPA